MATKIVVACGSGVATSEMVAAKIRKLLASENVEAEVVPVEISRLDEELEDADVYIPVVRTEGSYDVPVLNGVAFLTGMNQEEEFSKLLDIIRFE